MSGVTLSGPPYSAPISDAQGIVTPAWQKWFQQMYVRIGQTAAIPNASATILSSALTSVYVSNADTTIYVSPIGQSTVIDAFTATNTGTVVHFLAVNLVPYNALPGASNVVVGSLAIQPGATVSIPAVVGQVLTSGAYISCASEVRDVISVRLTGRPV